jgi:gamma-glutamylcysteine synthetase
MALLPVLHRRRSKTQRALDLAKDAAKVWTAVRVSSAGARVARQGAKVAGRRPRLRMLAVPVAVAGAVVVWRMAHKGDEGREPDFDRPLGPVAHAETVSPPADAAAEAARAEAETSAAS